MDDEASVSFADVLHGWFDTLNSIFARSIGRSEIRETVVLRERSAIHVEGGVVPTAEPGPQIAAALVALVRNAPRDLTLDVATSEVLRAEISMPRASQATLRRAIRYEIGGLSPLGADAVYYDFSTTLSPHGQSLVQLSMVSRDLIDTTIALCHAAGLRVAEIRLAGQPAHWQHMPIDRMAFLGLFWRRHKLALLFALNLGLLLIVLAAAYVRLEDRTQAIVSAAQNAEIGARQVEHGNTRVQAALSAQAFFVAQRKAPSLIAVLADLSQVLPDGTWLERLEMHGRRLSLQGLSRSPTVLLAILERSGRFSNAQFTAPVTRQPDGVERFEISVEALAHD